MISLTIYCSGLLSSLGDEHCTESNSSYNCECGSRTGCRVAALAAFRRLAGLFAALRLCLAVRCAVSLRIGLCRSRDSLGLVETALRASSLSYDRTVFLRILYPLAEGVSLNIYILLASCAVLPMIFGIVEPLFAAVMAECGDDQLFFGYLSVRRILGICTVVDKVLVAS